MAKIEVIKKAIDRLTVEDKVRLFNDWAAGSGGEYVYDMCEFDGMMGEATPSELARRLCANDGFNPNDEYFRVSNYGDLESMSEDDVLQRVRANLDVIAWAVFQGDVEAPPTVAEAAARAARPRAEWEVF